ncbi:trichohyalin-like [Seriola aureovittata]|uniref:trichohyalin-like n=1 Tax=Seriola aureovittata TaxID=2871759 RepID=UPI0024BEF1CA|nr:trichohyalin-like [Seriola aureovittata]
MRKASNSRSSRSTRYRYRTLAPISQVDDTLFGSLKPSPPEKPEISLAMPQEGETAQDRQRQMERHQLRENQERVDLEDLDQRRKNQQRQQMKLNAETVRAEEQRREEREEELLRSRLRAQREKELAVMKEREEALLRTILRQKEEEDKLRQRVLRKTVHQQLWEREQSAMSRQRQSISAADQLIMEEQQRRMRLHEIAEETLMELRFIGIPEKYCRRVAVFPRPRTQDSTRINSTESELRPTCLPAISRSAKAPVCKLQPASATSSYTRLPPIWSKYQ